MSEFTKRYLVAVALLIFSATFIFFYQMVGQTVAVDVDIFEIPLEIGEWQAKEIPVEDRILDILETQSVLIREYTNKNGVRVLLTIVYYQGNRVELHLPERCSVGQGSDIVETGQEIIKNEKHKNAITANKLIVKSDKGSQVILYYFETGTFCTPSYQGLRWHMIKNKLKGKMNSGALVKFSAPIKQNPDKTIKILKQFIKEMSPLLPDYLI